MDFSSMGFDDISTNRQTQPCPSMLPGGKKGFKNSRKSAGTNPFPIILKRDTQARYPFMSFFVNGKPEAASNGHSLNGILDHIQYHLFQLISIGL
jgi:hypothetical protein